MLSLHSLNEPGELSQGFSHDDSTINISLCIIIVMVTSAMHIKPSFFGINDFILWYKNVYLKAIVSGDYQHQ